MGINTYQQPSIFFGNLRIDEPITSLTDIFVSIVCFYAFFQLKLYNFQSPISNIRYYFRRYFFLMGLATLYGGIIGHAFLYKLSFSWKLPGWCLSMISMNFLERALIEYTKWIIPKKIGIFLTWLNIVELIVFLLLIIVIQKFYLVEIHSAYGLLCIVLPFSIFLLIKSKEKIPAKFFLAATFIMIITSIIFKNKIGLSPWFNHNDIAHLLMCLAGLFFYWGSKKIQLKN